MSSLITPNLNTEQLSPSIVKYAQFSSAAINFIIGIFMLLIIFNALFNLLNTNDSSLLKIIKLLNMLVLYIVVCIIILKFYFSLKLEQCLGWTYYDLKLIFFTNNNHINYLHHINVFSSSFSDAILLLSILTGLVCLELLGSKNLLNNVNNLSVFLFFNFFVTIMVTTNNLLIMFLCFEFIFLPTMFFVYKLGYSKKIDKANESLFYWTLFGSFLVLCTLIYVFYSRKTLNYIYLQNTNFSKIEANVIFICLLIGFGIKIPLVPFHAWLLKVHVESPTAFSIFLSGFLVKSALYCLYILLSTFTNLVNYYLLGGWVICSLIVSTFGLASQVDLKKLIAWATIQEMSFMLVFLIFKQLYLTHICVIFIILHGLMSSYMFYLVDILQRRFNTRSLSVIKGLHLLSPKASRYLWFLILLFSGFPLTSKFFIEWHLIALMTETTTTLLICVVLLVNFLGSIFFCKIIFTMIYGVQEDVNFNFVEIQKKECIILNFLSIFIILLLGLLFVV